jgi:hypothetical protein
MQYIFDRNQIEALLHQYYDLQETCVTDNEISFFKGAQEALKLLLETDTPCEAIERAILGLKGKSGEKSASFFPGKQISNMRAQIQILEELKEGRFHVPYDIADNCGE